MPDANKGAKKCPRERERPARPRGLLSNVGRWSLELDTARLSLSPECKALYGVAADAPFSYSDCVRSIHPEDQEEQREALALAVEKTGQCEWKYRVIWADGSIHRLHSIGSVAPTVDGTPFRLVGATIEIPVGE